MKEYLNVRKSDLVEVLTILETLVLSLDRIGSHRRELDRVAYERILAKFIEDWNVGRELLTARRLLSAYFDDTVGDDDQDELERAMSDTPYWKWDRRRPPARTRDHSERSSNSVRPPEAF